MPDILPEKNSTTSSTTKPSSNMNRNTINAMAIRSHQVEDGETVGVASDSFEETGVLKVEFRIHTGLNTDNTHLCRLIDPYFQVEWDFIRGSRNHDASIVGVDKSLRLIQDVIPQFEWP
jgi:hypothetical protein